jgi:hypothetical protein
MAKKLSKPEFDPEPDPEDDDAPGVGVIIQINEDWRLKHDGLQFCIQKKRTSLSGKTKGEVYWDNWAFCREIGNAILWLASRRIYGIKGVYGIEGLDMMAKAIEEIKAELREAHAKGLKVAA